MTRVGLFICVMSLAFGGIGEVTTAEARTVRIPSGTVVVLNTTNSYSSESAKADELVTLVVASDVVVDGAVVIRAGASGVGVIEELQSTEMLGREGRLSIAINSAQAVDGKSVPLTGRISARGQDEMTGTVVGAIFCPLFLLNKGGEAQIPAGAQGRGIVLGEVLVNVP